MIRLSNVENAELRTQVVRKESEPPFVELVDDRRTTVSPLASVAFDKLRQRCGELFSGLQRGEC